MSNDGRESTKTERAYDQFLVSSRCFDKMLWYFSPKQNAASAIHDELKEVDRVWQEVKKAFIEEYGEELFIDKL